MISGLVAMIRDGDDPTSCENYKTTGNITLLAWGNTHHRHLHVMWKVANSGIMWMWYAKFVQMSTLDLNVLSRSVNF